MDTLQNTKNKLTDANKDLMQFLNAFVDEKSFVETDAFVCSEKDGFEGVVCGFATIDGNAVCVFATNPKTVKGAIGARAAQKIVRTINNAVRTDKPIIAVWDTAGAKVEEGVDALEGYGSILRAFTVAYGEVPVISVIKGNDLGLSAYAAGLGDFVIAYENGAIASASPLVLSAKYGADVGSVKYAAERGLVTNVIKSDKELRPLLVKALAVFEGGEPSGDDLNRTSKALKAGVSAETLIKEVFDKNSFLAVRGDFAPVAVTGFATLGDITVGVVATDSSKSDGRLTADACVKIYEFLNACENAECPVIFAVDCVGTERCADDARLIREMSDLIYRVNTLDVDMFALVYGKVIGGAYTALVSPCEYKIAWEHAEIGALESEAAARLLFAEEIKSAKDKEKAVQKLADAYVEKNGNALLLARDGRFDNVIEPALTRKYLLSALFAHVE